jgi:O-antigen/teichoic acid export membrane protein
MMTGTVIAQAVPMLISPLLTRLYTPADYGVYGTFMFAAYTISALASARYEFAIMLPESDEEAANVVALCFATAGLVSGVTLVVTLGLQFAHLPTLEATRLGPWLFLLPPTVFLMSAYQTLNYWVIRKQQFRRLSISRVFRAIAMAGANVAFGLCAFHGGLLIASLLGQAIATAVLATQLFGEDREKLRGLKRAIMTDLARRYRQFPLFSLPADLLSTGSAQLPVAFLDTASAGLFTFVQTVVSAPLAVVSGSVHDAFKERASRDWRDQGQFRQIFLRLTRVLVALAIPATFVLVAFGPPLFAFVFGQQWRRGGELARILAIMYLAKVIASPLSYSYFIVEKQREDFLLHIYIAASTGVILALGKYLHASIDLTLEIFAANYVLFYLVFFVRSYQFSGGRVGDRVNDARTRRQPTDTSGS